MIKNKIADDSARAGERKSVFKTLTSKLLAIYVPLVTIAATILFLILEVIFYQEERDQLVGSVNSVASIQSAAFQAAVWEYDVDQVRRLLGDLELIPHLQGAVVFDSSDKIMAQVGDIESKPEIPEFKVDKALIYSPSGTEETIGRFVLTFHSRQIWLGVIEHLKVNAIILLVMVASLVASTMFAVHIVIGRPLDHLRRGIERAREVSVRTPVPWESSDELGQVVRAYNEMQKNEEAAEREVKKYQENLEALVEERTREVEHKSALLEAVLGSMNQGLVAYDDKLTLIISNEKFKEIRDVPDELAQPGASFVDWIRYDAERGEFDEGDPELITQKKVEQAKRFVTHDFERTRPNGIVMEIAGGPLPDGGFVSTFTDITERKKAEQKLTDAYDIISSSIDYASRIQRSVLPSHNILKSSFLDHFVIWDPRDVVGGDIYWCHNWGGGTLLILGDCTGHGVPGAFMTLISTGALERALIETPIGDVAGLVRRMHQFVQQTLGQDGDDAESDDGLELGACFVNSQNSKMTFVGARFDLFKVTGDDIKRYKGDKKGIGYKEIPKEQVFTEIDMDIAPSTTFYMTTDGAVDQIGDTTKRGYGKKRFEKLLLDIQGFSMDEQKETIRNELTRHQGEAPRLDDIAIFGFKTLPLSQSSLSDVMQLRPITAIQRIQDNLDAQGIFFCFSGYMTEDMLTSMGATLRQKMEIVKADKLEARAIFSIFVEQAQNIIRYSSDVLSIEGATPSELRRGFLAIGKEEGRYFVSCGNLVIQSHVERLRDHLVHISGMDENQLKKIYKVVLRGEVPEGSKGAGVGFIDIARRAKNGFEFDFKKVDDDYSYFFLKAFI